MLTGDVHSTIENESVGGYGILPSVVTNHSLSQPPTHSLDRSVNQSNKPVNQTTGQSINRSIH